MAVTVSSVPEQGQLVSVRSRQWVVTDVRASTLPPPALKPAFGGPQHLLTLASVGDDGLGEELQVIWGSSRGRGSRTSSPRSRRNSLSWINWKLPCRVGPGPGFWLAREPGEEAREYLERVEKAREIFRL
jgi:hypothetical protein